MIIYIDGEVHRQERAAWQEGGRISIRMKHMIGNVRLLVAGEQGMVVEFGNTISVEINGQVQQLAESIAKLKIVGVTEIMPTYRSVMVYFDPIIVSRAEMAEIVEQCLQQLDCETLPLPPRRIIRIPVCYGGVFGPDMDYVVRHTGLTEQEVVKVHTSRTYLAYMLGFTPGFPYLGDLPETLIVPRLSKLRAKIPEGSVGIAGSQTGFYTVQSTGGWRLIGRTPVKAFNPDSVEPFLFTAGSYIQFEPISVDDFFVIRQAVEEGSYTSSIVECPKELPE